jgi:hypothetical protein
LLVLSQVAGAQPPTYRQGQDSRPLPTAADLTRPGVRRRVWITGVGQQNNAGQTDCELNATESRQREKDCGTETLANIAAVTATEAGNERAGRKGAKCGMRIKGLEGGSKRLGGGGDQERRKWHKEIL